MASHRRNYLYENIKFGWNFLLINFISVHCRKLQQGDFNLVKTDLWKPDRVSLQELCLAVILDR
jgi:hypothetical protein